MAAARRNGRAITRQDLADALDANTKLTKAGFDNTEGLIEALDRNFEQYKSQHDQWGQARMGDVERRLGNIEQQLRDLAARQDREGSARRTVAAISAAIGGLVGAIATWVVTWAKGS